MTLFLIGFMGCGKSTIGRRVAGRLSYRFEDMDAEIVRHAGMSIAEIFATRGEEEFRRMERDYLRSLPIDDNVIIATGGGAPCFNDNLAEMKRRGHVVYFDMSPAALFTRLRRGRGHRPAIASMDDAQLAAHIECSLAVRRPIYLGASMVIDCNGVSDEYIAEHIRHYIDSADKTLLGIENE